MAYQLPSDSPIGDIVTRMYPGIFKGTFETAEHVPVSETNKNEVFDIVFKVTDEIKGDGTLVPYPSEFRYREFAVRQDHLAPGLTEEQKAAAKIKVDTKEINVVRRLAEIFFALGMARKTLRNILAADPGSFQALTVACIAELHKVPNLKANVVELKIVPVEKNNTVSNILSLTRYPNGMIGKHAGGVPVVRFSTKEAALAQGWRALQTPTEGTENAVPASSPDGVMKQGTQTGFGDDDF